MSETGRLMTPSRRAEIRREQGVSKLVIRTPFLIPQRGPYGLPDFELSTPRLPRLRALRALVPSRGVWPRPSFPPSDPVRDLGGS